MANEISISAALSVSKNGASIAGSGSASQDMTGAEMLSSVQTIATSPTAISVGGCDQVEYLFIKNLDATNYVTIGLVSATPPTSVISVIKPGKCVLLSGVSATLYAGANSSAVDLFVAVVET